MEEKLAGVFEAPGDKAGEQQETECPRGLLFLDNPRSEFRETPSHLLGYVPTTLSHSIPLHPKESFSSSFCGGMEQFFQCLTPAPPPAKVIQIPDLWRWKIPVLVNYSVMMDLEWTQSYRQWEAREFCDTGSGLKRHDGQWSKRMG